MHSHRNAEECVETTGVTLKVMDMSHMRMCDYFSQCLQVNLQQEKWNLNDYPTFPYLISLQQGTVQNNPHGNDGTSPLLAIAIVVVPETFNNYLHDNLLPTE